MGAKMSPRMKKVGRTERGVRMGCHALRRCCLKAVSTRVWARASDQQDDLNDITIARTSQRSMLHAPTPPQLTSRFPLSKRLLLLDDRPRIAAVAVRAGSTIWTADFGCWTGVCGSSTIEDGHRGL